MLKGGFDGPAVSVQRGDQRRRGIGHREISEDMQFGLAVAGRRAQLDRDPASDEGCPRLRFGQTHRLFIECLSPGIVANPATRTLGLSDHVRGMVANHKKCTASGYAKQNPSVQKFRSATIQSRCATSGTTSGSKVRSCV